MKRSDAIQELLNSYYFQHGKNADSKVIFKARKIIEGFIKEENKANNIIK